MSGIELQAAVAGRDHRLPIVFLTGRADIATGVRAMKAGASDFLTKPVKSDVLLQAIAAALSTDVERRRQRDEARALEARLDLLTAREREVYDGVVNGKLNKQIAAQIGTSIRTVKAHRAHMMQKMDARSVAELVRAADRLAKLSAVR